MSIPTAPISEMASTYEDVGDEEGDMIFESKIVDVGAGVEKTMRLSTIGIFDEAREEFATTVQPYISYFPILVVALRALFDQGDHEAIEAILDTTTSDVLSTSNWTADEYSLLCLLAEINKACKVHSYEELTTGIEWQDFICRLEDQSLREFSEEDV